MSKNPWNFAIVSAAALVIGFAIFRFFTSQLSYYVKPYEEWTPQHFHDFLSACDSEQLSFLENTFNIDSSQKNQEERVQSIKESFSYESSHIFEWILNDSEDVDYHNTVKWLAGKHGVSNHMIETQPTFILERLIFEQIFQKAWDDLPDDKKKLVLEEIDVEGILDITALVGLGGSSVLATLATTTYFSGFAFYTTMSTAIASVAGYFGITLPFSVYAGASSTAAILSGPVGWTLAAIGVAGSSALLGRADVAKTTDFVMRMHGLKVEALLQSGFEIPSTDEMLGSYQ